MQGRSRFAGLHQNSFKGRNRHVLAGVHGSMGLTLPVASWNFVVLLPILRLTKMLTAETLSKRKAGLQSMQQE